MSQFNPKVVESFGLELARQGRIMPSNSLYTSGLASRDKIIHRIGNRYLYSCFLLQRGGLYTVYANPRYSSYRTAFKEALSIDISQADIDHYFARAAAKEGMKLDKLLREEDSPAASPHGVIFLAMGAPPASINRSAQDKDDLNTMLMKVLGEKTLGTAVQSALGHRKFDDPAVAGRLLATGFQAPHGAVRWANIHKVSVDTLKGREKEIFAPYFAARGA